MFTTIRTRGFRRALSLGLVTIYNENWIGVVHGKEAYKTFDMICNRLLCRGLMLWCS
jgi:hypothetical protein